MRRVLLLLLLAGCAHAPKPQIDNNIYGYTVCNDGQPVILINLRIIRTPDDSSTVAHERVHGQQINRIGNCKAFDKWYKTNRAASEAEAYCADVRADAAMGRLSFDDALDKYATWLAGSVYGLNIKPDSARKLIAGFCK